MFCLRSWLPLLFIPTNASPIFVLTFFLLTYYLNRPCVYCSILLAILFASSCYWSDSCWFDGNVNAGANSTVLGAVGNNTAAASTGYNWFEPRYISSTIPNPLAVAGSGLNGSGDANSTAGSEMRFLAEVVNSTIWGLGGVAVQEVQKSGIGLGWARTLLGGAEWRVPLLGVDVRL